MVTALWKTVENAEISWRACSGCAGDYEDPDRTAWRDLAEDSEEVPAEHEVEAEEKDEEREES